MPQHKSAKKRVKTNLGRQTRNRAFRSTLKTNLKRVAELDNVDQAINEQQALLDRAVSHGIIHKKKAARLKSRFVASRRSPSK